MWHRLISRIKLCQVDPCFLGWAGVNLQPCSETSTNPCRVSTCVFPATVLWWRDWIGMPLGSSRFLCGILQLWGLGVLWANFGIWVFCCVYKNVLFYFWAIIILIEHFPWHGVIIWSVYTMCAKQVRVVSVFVAVRIVSCLWWTPRKHTGSWHHVASMSLILCDCWSETGEGGCLLVAHSWVPEDSVCRTLVLSRY